MRRFLSFLSVALLILATQACSTTKAGYSHSSGRSGIDAVGLPAVQDNFAGVSFGMKYPLVRGKLERKYHGLLMEFGKNVGISVRFFEFAGYSFNKAIFYTNGKYGFHKIIMTSDFSSNTDRDLMYGHYLNLLKEKYGSRLLSEDDSAYYRDLNGRSVLLSRKKPYELMLVYCDDTLNDMLHKKHLNEI